MKNENEGRVLNSEKEVSIDPCQGCEIQDNNGNCKSNGGCISHLAPVKNQAAVTAEDFLAFVHYTSYEVLTPVFHVSGDSVTHTCSELKSIYQEMLCNGSAYLRYLDAARQEDNVHGSS